jgi:Bacterial EndoU nuclease
MPIWAIDVDGLEPAKASGSAGEYAEATYEGDAEDVRGWYGNGSGGWTNGPQLTTPTDLQYKAAESIGVGATGGMYKIGNTQVYKETGNDQQERFQYYEASMNQWITYNPPSQADLDKLRVDGIGRMIDDAGTVVECIQEAAMCGGAGTVESTILYLGKKATKKALLKQAKATKDILEDLVGFRSAHILNRHRHGAGIPDKTEFPSTWDDEKIIKEINKIANNPKAPGGMGKWNSPYKTGNVDGLEIRVDFYPISHSEYSGRVSTGYPTNVTPNPK